MNTAFCNKEGSVWDNNAGRNFYVPVKLTTLGSQLESVDQVASRNGSRIWFSTPEVLEAGGTACIYFNRKRSPSLRDSPNVKLHFGFNDWEIQGEEGGRLDLRPSQLWRDHHTDWWLSAPFTVPLEATQINFAFTDGHLAWDNNDGENYSAPVKAPRERRAARSITSVDSSEHAHGTLHVIHLTPRRELAGRDFHADEKIIRVWTPPGYDPGNAPGDGYPALWMNDGNNMFEDWLAHQGVSWRVGETASRMIFEGRVPPFLVVAVDSPGPYRSLNLLPYKPGSGLGGFRGDCERWPGGGVDNYMHRIVEEIMPLVRERFAISSDNSKNAFGGGSFAGVTALYAALRFPHVFGSILAESPSLWIAEGRFLEDLAAHKGRLPERMFIGCGTKEYSATRDHERADVDDLLLSYYVRAAQILEEKGLRSQDGRLAFQVEADAGHHELAWRWRLTGALDFLLSPWWESYA
eukprot:jgi/Botrbrau1/8558/Bobra.0359s0022.1